MTQGTRKIHGVTRFFVRSVPPLHALARSVVRLALQSRFWNDLRSLMRPRIGASALVATSFLLAPSLAEAASAWPPPHHHRAQHSIAPAQLGASPLAGSVAGPPLPPIDAAPTGYHTERRYIAGLIFPGAVISLVGSLVLASALSSSASADEDYKRARAQGSEFTEEAAHRHEYDGLFTTIGVAHLAVGVPLLTLGLLFPRHIYVANQVSIAFVPLVSSERAGGTFVMRF